MQHGRKRQKKPHSFRPADQKPDSRKKLRTGNCPPDKTGRGTAGKAVLQWTVSTEPDDQEPDSQIRSRKASGLQKTTVQEEKKEESYD